MSYAVTDSTPRAGDSAARDFQSPESKASSGIDFALQSFVVQARSAQGEFIGAKAMSSEDMQKEIDGLAKTNIYAAAVAPKANLASRQRELSPNESQAMNMQFDNIFGDEHLGKGYMS